MPETNFNSNIPLLVLLYIGVDKQDHHFCLSYNQSIFPQFSYPLDWMSQR